MSHDIRETLSNPRLRDKIAAIVARRFEEMRQQNAIAPREIELTRIRYCLPSDLMLLLRDEKNLPGCLRTRLNAQDFVTAACAHLPFGNGEDFLPAFNRMIDDLVAFAATPRAAEPFTLCQMNPDGSTIFGDQFPVGLREPIWTGGGWSLEVLDSIDDELICMIERATAGGARFDDILNALSQGHHPLHAQVRVRVVGAACANAFKDSSNEIKDIALMAAHCWSYVSRVETVTSPDDAEDPSFPRSLRFFQDCLGRCFGRDDSADKSLNRRIRNAAQLLIEADRQTHAGVSLSLSFSAIEALVCRNREGITDELSRNVATLLIEIPAIRVKAIERIKKLYGLRSSLLHGGDVTSDADSANSVRAIASQVLIAVIEWNRFVIRMGNDQPKSQDFCEELSKTHIAGAALVGASPVESQYFSRAIFS